MSDNYIISGHFDGNLRVWCPNTKNLLNEIKDLHEETITSVAFHNSNNNLLLTNSRDHTMKLIDIRTF